MSEIDSAAPPSPASPPNPSPRAKRPAGSGKSGGKAPRRRARELALQGLYAWLLSGSDAPAIEATLREETGFAQADREHFDALLNGCMAEAAALDALLVKHIDRKVEMLSPVEHAALWIGCYELQRCIEIPYRVVINEAVELAKSFGGTDGHRYVNGVLDKLAAQLRPVEVADAPPRRGSAPRASE